MRPMSEHGAARQDEDMALIYATKTEATQRESQSFW